MEARSQKIWKEGGDKAGEGKIEGNLLCCSLRVDLLVSQRQRFVKP